jgi:hypothetical protein
LALKACEPNAARDTPPAPGCVPCYDVPLAIPPLDLAHRERRHFGPAPPAAQERGERFAQPDAWRRSGARRPSSVAATAGVRLGDGALS